MTLLVTNNIAPFIVILNPLGVRTDTPKDLREDGLGGGFTRWGLCN